MNSFSPPELNLEYICVTSKKNALVGALISNYFNDSGVYFVVLTFPDLEAPYAATLDFREDDFIPKMMGTQAAIRINNVIARLHPRKVILAGMNEAQKTYVRAHIPKQMIIEVDRKDDVDGSLVSLAKRFDGTIVCRPTEIVQGLLLGKYSNKKIVVDETAPHLDDRRLERGTGLVVIENNGTSDDVVAVNYAFSIGADVALVRPIHRTDVHSVQKCIYEWIAKGSDNAYQQLRQKLVERIDGLNVLDYKFATFFTLGFPYGLLLNNMIPFTHVFVHPGCDLFIVNNIGSELFSSPDGSALVFSPRLFQREETDDVINALEQKKFLVRALLGDKASVNALAYYGEHFPFNLLHICSHGGETNGYHVVQDFLDRAGQPHSLEYEEIVGVSPAGEGQVTVIRKVLFRTFDGICVDE